jgi:hypothetical protein
MNLEELKAEALRLEPKARAKLAHAPLESLEDLSEAEIESLWVAEAFSSPGIRNLTAAEARRRCTERSEVNASGCQSKLDYDGKGLD